MADFFSLSFSATFQMPAGGQPGTDNASSDY